MDFKNKLISSHIFVFPFRWDYISNGEGLYGSIDKRLNVNKVVKIIKDTGCWDKDKPNIENDDAEYSKYIYFYDNVRDAIYGKNKYRDVRKELYNNFNKKSFLFRKVIKKNIRNRVVQCFKYNKVNDKSTYNIKISKKEKVYSLNIKSIKLKIYDTGVAALSFFLENYDQDSTSEDILNINDYGRRVFPQFLPLKEAQNSFLAEKISLELMHKNVEEDFNYEVKKNPNRISNIIMVLLGHKFKYDIRKTEIRQVFISPIMDDRMFVLSMYRNNYKSESLTKQSTYMYDYMNSEFWYKYIFIDNYNLTCQNKEMLKKLIKKATYTRWNNCGTLYGISRYSFVIVVDEKDFALDVLFKHFNNMYYEMSLLALIERASILRISDEASKITALDEDEALKNIKKLQRYYIEFINDLYFREVTAQEQGIELFNKLVKMMEIERDVKRLGDEIEQIQKYTSMISNERISMLLRMITYVGLIFTACTFVINVFGNKFVPIRKLQSDLITNELTSWFIQRLIISVGLIGIIIFGFEKLIKTDYINIVKKIFWICFICVSIIAIFLNII